MKKIFFLIFIDIFLNCTSQQKETVYLLFDLKNNDINENSKSKKYIRNKNSFFINNQYFSIKKKIENFKENKVTYSNIKYLTNKWYESELFSSVNVFDKVYIVERVNEINILYEVIWNGKK